MKRCKKIIALLFGVLIILLSLNIIFVSDSEVIVKTQVDGVFSDEEKSLEQYINSQSDVKFTGVNTIFSDKIGCKVIVPDVSAYIRANIDELSFMDYQSLYKHVVNAIETKNIKKTEIKFEVPVVRDGLRLKIDLQNSEEYVDAVSGGLYSLYDELLLEMLKEAEETQ